MSNISLIIEERAVSIGNFMVGRLLPFRHKRAVGPFVFIDHMGPASLSDQENIDIGPHPHIGLSTLTYLFEGSIMHRDSIGTAIEIKPGEINWMTAGKGVVHSERTPEHLRNTDKRLHGLQIWVALPKQLENMDPAFAHITSDEIPTWQEEDLDYKLIAGQAMGKTSPVPVHSPLYLIEIKSKKASLVNIGSHLTGESALYVMDGSIRSENNVYQSKQILIAKDSTLCAFEIAANSTVYIFGGEPFSEERFIDWNFVSSDKEVIRQAKIDWQEQKFPQIPGEVGFVPLPRRPHLK